MNEAAIEIGFYSKKKKERKNNTHIFQNTCELELGSKTQHI